MSNALAIERLGLGKVMRKLDREIIADWLNTSASRRITFPDTAQDVAQWIADGKWNNTESLIRGLWGKTRGYDL